MYLDDVYGSDADRFPLEQEMLDVSESDYVLEWDEVDSREFSSAGTLRVQQFN